MSQGRGACCRSSRSSPGILGGRRLGLRFVLGRVVLRHSFSLLNDRDEPSCEKGVRGIRSGACPALPFESRVVLAGLLCAPATAQLGAAPPSRRRTPSPNPSACSARRCSGMSSSRATTRSPAARATSPRRVDRSASGHGQPPPRDRRRVRHSGRPLRVGGCAPREQHRRCPARPDLRLRAPGDRASVAVDDRRVLTSTKALLGRPRRHDLHQPGDRSGQHPVRRRPRVAVGRPDPLVRRDGGRRPHLGRRALQARCASWPSPSPPTSPRRGGRDPDALRLPRRVRRRLRRSGHHRGAHRVRACHLPAHAQPGPDSLGPLHRGRRARAHVTGAPGAQRLHVQRRCAAPSATRLRSSPTAATGTSACATSPRTTDVAR